MLAQTWKRAGNKVTAYQSERRSHIGLRRSRGRAMLGLRGRISLLSRRPSRTKMAKAGPEKQVSCKGGGVPSHGDEGRCGQPRRLPFARTVAHRRPDAFTVEYVCHGPCARPAQRAPSAGGTEASQAGASGVSDAWASPAIHPPLRHLPGSRHACCCSVCKGGLPLWRQSPAVSWSAWKEGVRSTGRSIECDAPQEFDHRGQSARIRRGDFHEHRSV